MATLLKKNLSAMLVYFKEIKKIDEILVRIFAAGFKTYDNNLIEGMVSKLFKTKSAINTHNNH